MIHDGIKRVDVVQLAIYKVSFYRHHFDEAVCVAVRGACQPIPGRFAYAGSEGFHFILGVELSGGQFALGTRTFWVLLLGIIKQHRLAGWLQEGETEFVQN